MKTTMTRPRTHAQIALLTVLLSTALASCSGSDGNDTAAPPLAPAPAPAPPPAAPAPAPAPSPVPPPATTRSYQGCYGDKGERALPYLLNGLDNSVDGCVAVAQSAGLPYAGVQAGGQCWGGRELRYEKLAESSCNTPCSDNKSETCGGPLINSIYSSGAVISEAPAPAPPELRPPCDLKGVPTETWHGITPDAFKAKPNMESPFAITDLQKPGVLYSTASNRTGGGDMDGTSSYTTAGMYKSVDCGTTWQPANTPAGVNYHATRTGVVWGFLSGNHSNVQYAVVGYGEGGLIRSTDGGANWTSLFPVDSPVRRIFDPAAPLFAQSIGLDPADDKHLLVTFHTNCYGPSRAATHNCMAETLDGGISWRTFYAAVPETGWFEGASVFVLGKSRWIFFGRGGHYTGDGGKTWQEISPNVFYASAATIVDGALYVSGDGVMRVSRGTATAPLGAPGTWSVIPNAPGATTLVSDGVNLYASSSSDYSGQPFRYAPLSDLSHWKTMPSPPIGRGASTLSYDPQNHALYAATSVLVNGKVVPGGMWRFITK